MTAKTRTRARHILALLVAVVAAWLSVRQVDWPLLGKMLSGVQLGFLALALMAVLVTTAIKAARWQVLLAACTPGIPLARTTRVLLIGQMANSLLSRLGDLARALLLGFQAEGGIPAVLGTILAEKALDGVAGLFLLLVLALATPLPTWLRGPLLGLAALTAGLLLALAWASRKPTRPRRPLARLLAALPAGLGGRLERLAKGLALGLGLFRQPARALLALALSAAVWGLAALTNVLTLAALDIAAPAWVAWLVVVTAYAATFLPTIPAQIGVFEYAAVLSLEAGGVGAEPALAFALVLHLLVYLPPALLGPLSMAVEGLSWQKLKSASPGALEGDHASG
jgi:uncharacterized membrane protein YbhN (UPF0104 family)